MRINLNYPAISVEIKNEKQGKTRGYEFGLRNTF